MFGLVVSHRGPNLVSSRWRHHGRRRLAALAGFGHRATTSSRCPTLSKFDAAVVVVGGGGEWEHADDDDDDDDYERSG